MSLEELSDRALDQPPHEPAIEYADRWIAWGELRRIADQVKRLLHRPGRPPVTFLPANRPSSAAALLGLITMSQTVQMVCADQSPAELLADLDSLAPSALIAAAETLSDRMLSDLSDRGTLVIALDERDARLILPGDPRAAAKIAPQRQIQALTSGATGPPRRLPLSYDVIAEHMVGINSMFAGRGTWALRNAPSLFYSPLGAIWGVQALLQPLLNGDRLVMVDRFSVTAWHDYILRHRPPYASLPADAVQMVLDAEIPVEDLAGLTAISSGAAPLEPAVQERFEERYGVAILYGYGAAELAGGVAAMTPELYATWGRKKRGSAGRAAFGAKLRVVDPDCGAPLPAGTEGLLEVITPRVGPDWIRTSDFAVVDEDGFLFHRGRAESAIQRAGQRVLAEPIERALLLHPAVQAAAVVGLPDRRLGQSPGAAVQLKRSVVAPRVEELEAHLRKHLRAAAIPTIWRIVEGLPRTPLLKVDRPAVRRLFGDLATLPPELQDPAETYATGPG